MEVHLTSVVCSSPLRAPGGVIAVGVDEVDPEWICHGRAGTSSSPLLARLCDVLNSFRS
jgi:hypothetical protein